MPSPNVFDQILSRLNRDEKAKTSMNQLMFQLLAKNPRIASYDLRTLIPVVEGMEFLREAAQNANASARVEEVDTWLEEVGNLSKALWFTRELVHRIVELMTSDQFTPEFKESLSKDYKAFLASQAMAKDGPTDAA